MRPWIGHVRYAIKETKFSAEKDWVKKGLELDICLVCNQENCRKALKKSDLLAKAHSILSSMF